MSSERQDEFSQISHLPSWHGVKKRSDWCAAGGRRGGLLNREVRRDAPSLHPRLRPGSECGQRVKNSWRRNIARQGVQQHGNHALVDLYVANSSTTSLPLRIKGQDGGYVAHSHRGYVTSIRLPSEPPYSKTAPDHEPFKRGPPLTSPFTQEDTAARGVGLSPIQHIVGENAVRFKGFFALLVAINAPPGSFNITPRIPAYHAPASMYILNRTRNQARRTVRVVQGLNKIGFIFPDWVYFGPLLYHLALPRVVVFQFELDFLSQEPRLLIEIPRDVIEKRSHRPCSSSECSAPLRFNQSQLLVHSFIHFNNGVSVYRGKLDGQTVVVKAYEALGFDGLLREIRAYERLRCLPSVPKVFGVFGPSDTAWAALVIEDRGISLDSEQRWATLPLQERLTIYDTAVDLHLAGVHHGDLVARNFVRDKEGRLSIVDFGHAAIDHACEPDVCPELSDLRQNLGL
ncbi:hypothetical protein B0H19DRAFT_1063092 [Mycena capillaripes]|nr:hypothetical protein B0H19DRAFT_1063092 [Mycena capillaripes]